MLNFNYTSVNWNHEVDAAHFHEIRLHQHHMV